MSQKDERKKAIEKVRKMRDRALGAGSSENEVNKAMEVMGELMDTFDITMDEVSLAAEECKMVQVTHHLGSVFHLGTVTVAIAKFCDCVVYRTSGSKIQKRDRAGNLVYGRDARGRMKPHYEKASYTSNFYGIESDAETAAYLMELVRAAAVTMTEDYKKTVEYKTYVGSKTSLTKSFVDGFSMRLIRRLEELKAQRETELDRARAARAEMGENQQTLDAEAAAAQRRAGRSTDLIALKDAKVKDDFKAKYGWTVKYRNTRYGYGGSYTGRAAGASAADTVNLSRPIGNGGGYGGQLQIGN